MTAFARITAEHDRILSELTPCSGQLYRWLLRATPAGKPQEVLLEEFQQQTGYSLKWIKASLGALIENELVEVVRRYSGRIFKLICFHPEKKTSDDVRETSQKRQQTSTKQAQNADSSVRSYRENIKKQTEPTHPPVENEQGDVCIHEQTPQAAEGRNQKTEERKPETEQKMSGQGKVPAAISVEIAPEYAALLNESEQYGVRLTPQIIALVTDATIANAADAIAALKENKEQGKVKNPTGFLCQAIKNKWKPNQGKMQEGSEQAKAIALETRTAPVGFNEWFDLARSIGLVSAATMQDGIQYVFTNLNEREEWETFARLFPLEELREMQKRA